MLVSSTEAVIVGKAVGNFFGNGWWWVIDPTTGIWWKDYLPFGSVRVLNQIGIERSGSNCWKESKGLQRQRVVRLAKEGQRP